MEKDRNDQAVTPVLGDFSWKYEEVRRGAASIILVFLSGRTCECLKTDDFFSPRFEKTFQEKFKPESLRRWVPPVEKNG